MIKKRVCLFYECRAREEDEICFIVDKRKGREKEKNIFDWLPCSYWWWCLTKHILKYPSWNLISCTNFYPMLLPLVLLGEVNLVSCGTVWFSPGYIHHASSGRGASYIYLSALKMFHLKVKLVTNYMRGKDNLGIVNGRTWNSKCFVMFCVENEGDSWNGPKRN